MWPCSIIYGALNTRSPVCSAGRLRLNTVSRWILSYLMWYVPLCTVFVLSSFLFHLRVLFAYLCIAGNARNDRL